MNYNKLPKDEPIKYVKLANPKLEQHENLSNGMPNYNIKYNIMAQVNNLTDKAMCDAIIKYATEQGITDLLLIDEKFVKSALINEAKLREPTHQVADVRKPRTNFDKITENEVALAEFLATYGIACCIGGKKCDTNSNCKDCIKEWLQKECDND